LRRATGGKGETAGNRARPVRYRTIVRAALIIAVVCAPAAATADGQVVYGELGGKGGLYGAGYDREVAPGLTVGAAVSASHLDGETALSLSPYLGYYPVRRGRHALFGHLGPTVVHSRIASPVPEWDGDSSTGVGATVAAGYEYRPAPLVVRGYLMMTAGRGGVAPWAGVSVGVSF
jgi:hypothetical protein